MSHAATVKEMVPLLAVRDMAWSLAFYRDQVGFALAQQAEAEGRIIWCRFESPTDVPPAGEPGEACPN